MIAGLKVWGADYSCPEAPFSLPGFGTKKMKYPSRLSSKDPFLKGVDPESFSQKATGSTRDFGASDEQA